MSRKYDLLAALGLLGLLFAFYPGLFLVKAAPLTGDHLEQHYPWAYLLAQSLKEFKLPFWTPLIHCGFPLIAESQIGAFYIPNLLMYFFLPFHTAYSYMNLVHWFISGWGTYLYAKQMKLAPMAAFVAAIIFTFGSAYGGAFYNMTSLKTICWFPVALYFFERYLDRGQRRFLVGLAFIVAQSVIAGYLQMAALTWLIFGVYVILRIFAFSEKTETWADKIRNFGVLVISVACAVLLAFPQLFLTFQLAILSNRTGLEEGYAYVGSMSPAVLGTLIAPTLSLALRGNNLYAGLFALWLVLVAVCSPESRRRSVMRLWIGMTLLALFLALGRWSPLYVAIIKLTKFHSFRIPSKFLVFLCFGIAMLAGVGFQRLWEKKLEKQTLQKASAIYFGMLAGLGSLVTLLYYFLTAGREKILALGDYYVRHFVYAQPGHPHSLNTYLDAVKRYPENLLSYFNGSNLSNLWLGVMIAMSVLLIFGVLRAAGRIRGWLLAGVLLLCVDLYGASYLDIQRDLDTYAKAEAPSPLIDQLRQDAASGQLGRIYGFRASGENLPLTPSRNILYGWDDIGIYTPFVLSRYYQTIGLFGNINDSNYAVTPTPAFVSFHTPLLNFLNVSHILSTVPLPAPSFSLIGTDPVSKELLYRNEGKRAEAFFMKKWEILENWDVLKRAFMANGFDPANRLLLERSEFSKVLVPKSSGSLKGPDMRAEIRCLDKEDMKESWEIVSPAQGFFVTSKICFPGWQALLDGRPVPVLKAYGMFRAIYVGDPGRHTVEFRYHPSQKRQAL